MIELSTAREVNEIYANADADYHSLGLDSNGNLALSFTDRTNKELLIWVDDGYSGGVAKDGLANGGEANSAVLNVTEIEFGFGII